MKLDYVIVAGGCFWGLEDLLRGRLRKRNLKHVKPSRVIFSHRLVAHPLVTHACTTFVV